jgi:SAM-dependent methyltransferase
MYSVTKGDISNQYSALVRERAAIFPHFFRYQRRSAANLYQELRPLILRGEISEIYDLGCGTGEILCYLAELIEQDLGLIPSNLILCGFDMNARSIAIAKRLRSREKLQAATLQFHITAPNSLILDEIDARRASQISGRKGFSQIAVLCTGHSVFHLNYLPALFETMREQPTRRPKLWAIDIYRSWDRLLRSLGHRDHLEKRTTRSRSTDRHLEYFLFAHRLPGSHDRLARGLYEVSACPPARRTIVSTVQWAWSERELADRFLSLGYRLNRRTFTSSGYGGMIRSYFSLVP